MQDWAVEHLSCIFCGHGLQDYGGSLVCEGCDEEFPVENGVPRLVEEPTNIETAERFGHQWWRYDRWGFYGESDIPGENGGHHERGLYSATSDLFHRKTMISPEELSPGAVVLDAGCGNGKFAYYAGRSGVRVIGMDIHASTVETARENCSELDNVQIVQGDLLNPPLDAETFDIIYSIGVLHHTDDAEFAFSNLADSLKDGGTMAVWMYGKNTVMFRLNDFLIRSVTKRLSIPANLRFARAVSSTGRAIHNLSPLLYRTVNKFIRLNRNPLMAYDWYSAPVATRHTFEELEDWFSENGLTVSDTTRDVWFDRNTPVHRFIRRNLLGVRSVAVKGINRGPGG